MSKIPVGELASILTHIPKMEDENLIVGFDKSDDGSVYKIDEEKGIIQSLDFFQPMTDDPYLFGKIAAANSLSDIYAMGGDVLTALNIVCFPKKENMEVLKEILRGGAEKIIEGGGIITGGHSIVDTDIKYGLSVMGIVDPKKILKNNGCKIGDKIILTKPLGTGIIMTRYSKHREKNKGYEQAIEVMETLNKKTGDIMKKYKVTACTDVTGFGFLGHLNEMVQENYTIEINSGNVNYIEDAYTYAKGSITTSSGGKNGIFLENKIEYKIKDKPLIEIMLDPQTSGGLIISVDKDDSSNMLKELQENGIVSSIVGEVIERESKNIVVK